MADIDVKVEVLAPECQFCPEFEIKSIELAEGYRIHRCKHVQFCRGMIDMWISFQQKGGVAADESKE